MRKCGRGQLDSSRPFPLRLSTFLQPERWVRSRSPIHRGGDERASERGRACALATPVKTRLPVRKTETVRAAVTRNAQQELPGSWPGCVGDERSLMPSRRDNASGAGRVATAGGSARQQQATRQQERTGAMSGRFGGLPCRWRQWAVAADARPGSQRGSGFARSAIRPAPQQGGQSERISSVRRADRMESLKDRKAATPRRGNGEAVWWVLCGEQDGQDGPVCVA